MVQDISIAIMMEHPLPGKGGRHRQTISYGQSPNLSLLPREALAIEIRPLAKINRTGKMPIPQEKITLVGWASCPSHQLMKRIFARGLLEMREQFIAVRDFTRHKLGAAYSKLSSQIS